MEHLGGHWKGAQFAGCDDWIPRVVSYSRASRLKTGCRSPSDFPNWKDLPHARAPLTGTKLPPNQTLLTVTLWTSRERWPLFLYLEEWREQDRSGRGRAPF